MVKVSITVGTSAIEVEGEHEEVVEILDKFWNKPLTPVTADVAPLNAEHGPPPPSEEGQTHYVVKKQKPKTKTGAGGQGKASEEETEIANSIKSHDQYDAFAEKIILQQGDWLRKVQMVIYVAGKALHSGNISRVLTSVGVKNSLPTISKTLSNNKASFITTGTNPETYEFTASSKKEFSEWLNLELSADG